MHADISSWLQRANRSQLCDIRRQAFAIEMHERGLIQSARIILLCRQNKMPTGLLSIERSAKTCEITSGEGDACSDIAIRRSFFVPVGANCPVNSYAEALIINVTQAELGRRIVLLRGLQVPITGRVVILTSP